jgi:signal transduction histidine kinase
MTAIDVQNLRVLIVEDDSTDYEFIHRALHQDPATIQLSSIKLTWTTSIAAAIDRVAQPFDLIISDLSLPDCQGIATVMQLREAFPSLPLLVLTGADDRAIEQAALKAGAQDFIKKEELSSHRLERAIDHAIQRHTYQREKAALLEQLETKNQLLQEHRGELIKQNQNLHELYQAAHHFVDEVSQEFRSPLSVISDYVSLVRDELVGSINEQQRQMLDVTSVRVEDLNNMVDNLLDVTKLESEMLGMRRRTCNLGDILQQVLPALQRKARIRDLEFNVDIRHPLPKVFCDGDRIARVITNLIDHALSNCESGGTVGLSAVTETLAGEVWICIADNGQGLTETESKLIAARKHTSALNLRKCGKDCSLGLAVTKEWIDLNFGDMRISSRPGLDTELSFCLPFANPTAIANRFLRFTCSRLTSNSSWQLIECVADQQVDGSGLIELETHFQSLIRRGDLLIRSGIASWVLLTKMSPKNASSMLDQLRPAPETNARSRLQRQLPTFHIGQPLQFVLPTDEDAVKIELQRLFLSNLCKSSAAAVGSREQTESSPLPAVAANASVESICKTENRFLDDRR